MKELLQEFIQERGKELVFISGAIVIALTLIFGYAYFVEGGDPFLPEGFKSTSSKVEGGVEDSLLITNEATANLNELLDLEVQGKTQEIRSNMGSYREPLGEIVPTVTELAEDIEKISTLISQVKPRRAQKIVSDAMSTAAIMGQRLLTFKENIDTLYEGLGDRINGGEVDGSYAVLVEEVNTQVRTINALYDQYNALMGQFRELTDD